MSDGDERRAKLRALVRELVEERLQHQAAAPFVPGESVIPYGARVYGPEEVCAGVDCLVDFWLTLGKEGERFETLFAARLGRRHALLVNSGSSANLVAVGSLFSPTLERPLRPGDEVLTVAAAFPTTVNPIVQYGAVPVFLDVEPDTANVDVSRLEEALGARTRAVVLAHTLGNPFDLGTVTAFCRRHGLYLVEDNCDALGSLYEGRPTGSFGDLATGSFYPPHHITMGEGGAVVTDDPVLAKVCASLRDWGRDCWCAAGQDDTCGGRFSRSWPRLPRGYDHKYVYSHLGYNLKPLDLQAAIGAVQLQRLDDFTAARRRNHERLRRELAPLEDRWRFQRATAGSEPSWFGFLMTLRRPDHEVLTALCRGLAERHIGHRRLFAGNLLRQPAYEGVPHRCVGPLQATDALCEGALFLGVYPGLTDEMVAYVARSMRELSDELVPGPGAS